ncbi:MAG: transcription antitermination factor NusB [Candidatus Krumholzibacteriota bacterium]|nr:transcription antitermination factor NusB [Candidatus Krumholzibacteriota bacterium]
MGKRRKAREIVLQALYESEFSEAGSDEILMRQIERRAPTSDTEDYARALYLKTLSSRVELDEMIRGCLENWDMERIALVDKNILRFALAEVLYFPEIPSRVILNEAIEIAHRYSTADAGRFVNGLLDRLIREHRSDSS